MFLSILFLVYTVRERAAGRDAGTRQDNGRIRTRERGKGEGREGGEKNEATHNEEGWGRRVGGDVTAR